ncbi:signal peptidase, endoplasmic reticulum-type [Geodermatophilus africanus]|uniref:Signal peptidase I n=1 Tax=Geodermatophilus africanus TaxID=1137993 RepID=A0A1H3G2P5_9ACTN|nr:signal peptidase I [Geodermatophilus africanus]SDX97380.1 signal peptidase, endoplasmic reticulum-type [Geodermatophilus africanus]
MTAPLLVGGAPRNRVPASPGRSLRPAVVLRVVVAAVLVALAGLVVLALAPRLAGFQGHVVVSGSMEPRLSAGDVVLTRPVPPQDLQPGQVLLFPDPEGADRLVLHRLVAFDARGDLVTRGDANQSDDTTHVPASSVIGEAQLRVPYVGLPAYWRFAGQWGSLAALAALLAAATVVVTGRPAGPRGRTSADRLADSPAADRLVRRAGLPPVPPAGQRPAGVRGGTPQVAGPAGA